MAQPTVYVTRVIARQGLDLLRDAAALTVWEKKELMPRHLQLAHFANCDGLLTTPDIPVDDALLTACPSLRAVSNHAVGFDNIDVAACTRRGIAVGNTPGVLSETTADLAFAMILAAARRVTELADWIKQDRWTPEVGLLENLGVDVHHATLGIIGMGRIGREVAGRAVGFRMNILYHNRNRDAQAEKEFGAAYAPKEELLRQSDFVSLHLPLTAQTRHYIARRELGLMKSSAILVNTGRGQLVNQNALLQALKNGEIAGAGLDVTDPEPMRGDDPLLLMPQVTVLPHIGSATRQTRIKMAETAARNLINALSGKPMVSCVNPEAVGRGRDAGRTP